MTLLSTEDHSSWPPRKNRGETLILLEASLTAVQKRPENIEAAETAETANCASGRLGKKGTKCVGDARSGGDSAGGGDRGRCQMNRVAKDGGASVHTTRVGGQNLEVILADFAGTRRATKTQRHEEYVAVFFLSSCLRGQLGSKTNAVRWGSTPFRSTFQGVPPRENAPRMKKAAGTMRFVSAAFDDLRQFTITWRRSVP